jgi:peptidoglycan hydrolase CwlO-like protein
MAKRSTIGENPLDFLVTENSLDTVVPGPAAASRATKVDERLERLEAEMAGIKALGPEISRTQTQVGQLQNEVTRIKAELERLNSALPQLRAEMGPLKAEVEEMKAEMSQLRARMVPSDIPWWMGGKKR